MSEIMARLRSGRRAGRVESSPSDRMKSVVERDISDSGNMRRLLAFLLTPEANCIDVGANRGAMLAEMSRVAPAGHHIAFEPLPHLCRLLRAQYPDVEVHQAALFNEPGEAAFSDFHGQADGWSGLRFDPFPGANKRSWRRSRSRSRCLIRCWIRLTALM